MFSKIMEQKELIKKFPNKGLELRGLKKTFENSCKEMAQWQDEAAALKPYRISHFSVL